MATITKSTASAPAFRAAMGKMKQQRSMAESKGWETYLFHWTVSIATTDLDDNDEVVVATLPSERPIYLDHLQVHLTDIDTGTPAHIANFQADATVLISASTVGQAGGYDEIDVDAGRYLDITGRSIKMVTTEPPATAAAGTLQVWLKVIMQKYAETGS